MEPFNQSELEVLREDVHRQFNNNHVSWISLSTIALMRLLERLDRAELRAKDLEYQLGRIYDAAFLRDLPEASHVEVDRIINWVLDKKHPGSLL